MIDPETLQLVRVYPRIEAERDVAFPEKRRVALIVPTCAQTLADAMHLQRLGLAIAIGGMEHPEVASPAAVLQHLGNGTKPVSGLIVFSDQLLSPADASVLVRTDDGEMYLSAFEAVLSLKYGFTLHVWQPDGYRRVNPDGTTLETVVRVLTAYLRDCAALGGQWDVRGLQGMRKPQARQAAALRRVRAMRSSVMGAFRKTPGGLEARRLLGELAALEARVETRGAA